MDAKTRAIIDAEPRPNMADYWDDPLIKAQEARRSELAGELMAADPRLPYISAFTIAGDKLTIERSQRWLDAGGSFWDVLPFIGSYGRMEFIFDNLAAGKVPAEEVYARLPEEWRGSDPDDTDPRFLALWQAAKDWNGGKYLRDGKALPSGTFTVYRGQDFGAPQGIAWSLDRACAERFANGAATRQHNRGGVVLSRQATRKQALAYMVGRGEAEVILPPEGSVE